MPFYMIDLLACIIATYSLCFISEKFIYGRKLTESEKLLIITSIQPYKKE